MLQTNPKQNLAANGFAIAGGISRTISVHSIPHLAEDFAALSGEYRPAPLPDKNLQAYIDSRHAVNEKYVLIRVLETLRDEAGSQMPHIVCENLKLIQDAMARVSKNMSDRESSGLNELAQPLLQAGTAEKQRRDHRNSAVQKIAIKL